jgi:hypothetical protein
MLNLERIPDQTGYLLLAEDGAVISVSIMILYIVTNCVGITKTNELHGAGPFLRGRQLCSYSRTSQHFCGTESIITMFTLALLWPLS